MLIDLFLQIIWMLVSTMQIDDSLVTPQFLASFKSVLEGLGPIIDAITPLTIVVPFGAYGIVLNFVIAVWLLYWPIRLIRWIVEWIRGKGGAD